MIRITPNVNVTPMQIAKHLQLPSINYVFNSTNSWELEAAVRVFQRQSGLTVDGIVGPLTVRELKYKTDKPPVRPVQIIKAYKETPYFTQRDNVYNPNGACNVTSLAMVLHTLGERPKQQQLEDELWEQLQTPAAQQHFRNNFDWAVKRRLNPSNVHGMLTWLAKQRGYQARFTYQARLGEIEAHLQKAPVIISGNFTGSGHIVTLVGLTKDYDFICHDPWGNWNQGYRNQNGENVIYNIESMTQILAGNVVQGRKRFLAHFIE